jgi:Ca2+-transporting ATPase
MTRSNADTTPSEPWHATPVDETFSTLATGEEGLSSEEADRRLSEYGTNDIQEAERASVLDLFLSQFRNPLIYLLVVAALLSLGTGFIPGGEPSYTEAVFIVLIIAANGVFGFVQDYQATRSIEALRELATPAATVLRDGENSRSTQNSSSQGMSSLSNRETRFRPTQEYSTPRSYGRTSPHSPGRVRPSRRQPGP